MADSKKPTRPTEVVIDGVTFPGIVTETSVKAMKSYDIRDDDVWVTTYQKAGTYWAVEIVNLVLADGNEDKIDRSKHPRPMECFFKLEAPGQVPQTPQYEEAKTWPSPRVFMTHLLEQMMPKQIYEGKGKVVFILRNPKDVAVSMWHFARPLKLNPKYEQWDTFFEQYCTDEITYSSWFTYNLTFWKKHRYDKNFLFLKYEDMKTDLRGAVVQIADFLVRPLSDEAIDRVVEKSTVGSMKKRFNTADGKSGKKIGAPSIIRKGIVGDWKNQFTVAQSEAFDKLYRDKMQGLDLHMQF